MSLGRTILRHVAISVLAGFAGLAIHFALMSAKDRLGILPEFQPYQDLQALLGGLAPGTFGWALPSVTGALLWGFIYGRVHDVLPAHGPLAKAAVFATLAWLVMAVVFFPVVGHGLFGLGLGRGLLPALLMLPMLVTFSLVLAVAHTWLRTVRFVHGSTVSAPPISNERMLK
ncbi:hypothetical protein GRZ55_17370 [Chelativorans sp. ZYF759]|uniref:DUF6789 family protein n=1 Tax=Chelativorans sp. ZYF759 TaxID=2692213 RepID=UPI00145F727C|nr:DUF6789 family protein [Chelativorans sp. ZYF759]NMG41021.1 hypothetical protein [Chelativorans sp. ZYF759]